MKFFEMPEIEIEKFQVNDVITVSFGPGEFDDDNTGEW